MKCCSVENCHNTEGKDGTRISFFSLPKNDKLAKKWLAFCGNRKKGKNIFVCSIHFKSDDICGGCRKVMYRARLRPGAVPSIRYPHGSGVKEERKMKNCVYDVLAPADIEEDFVQAENHQEIEETINIVQPSEQELKVNNVDDCLVDTESSEAVIDELSNQIKDLRLENFRLKVNFQLAQKQYKAEMNELKSRLQEAECEIFLLEMQLEDST